MTLIATIITKLRGGLGVEVIAVQTGTSADTIREEVQRLRDGGLIPGEIYGDERGPRDKHTATG